MPPMAPVDAVPIVGAPGRVRTTGVGLVGAGVAGAVVVGLGLGLVDGVTVGVGVVGVGEAEGVDPAVGQPVAWSR